MTLKPALNAISHPTLEVLNEMMNELIKLDAFQTALAEAKTIDEVKSLADQADLFRRWLKKQKAGIEAQNQGAIMNLQAQRKLGGMLKDQIKPGNPQLLHGATIGLSDLGIERTASHRWQSLAEIPEDEFNEYLVNLLPEEEITTAGFIRFHYKALIKPLLDEQPLPPGQFSVIACDPPWLYGDVYNPENRTGVCRYPQMSFESLAALDIPAATDCVFWLWTTNAFIHDAYHLLTEWGFASKTVLTWFKERGGTGYWLRGETEHCILATKGHPHKLSNEALTTHLKVKRSKTHSEKPDEFYVLVETLCGKATKQTHLEMFARKEREGWQPWGNEIDAR